MKIQIILIASLVALVLFAGCSSTQPNSAISTATKAPILTSLPTTRVTTLAPIQTTISRTTTNSEDCSCTENLYNCDDFSSHEAAQACYDHCKSLGKGDIHKLDGDKDGITCENLM